MSLGPDSQFISINFMDKDGVTIPVKNTRKPIKLRLPGSAPVKTFKKSELVVANWNRYFYQMLNVVGTDPSVHVKLEDFTDPDIKVLLVAYKGTSKDVEEGKCDDLTILPNPSKSCDYVLHVCWYFFYFSKLYFCSKLIPFVNIRKINLTLKSVCGTGLWYM